MFQQIAVGQQHRVIGLAGAQRDLVGGHHVRAVQEIGDAAEAFGFALGEETALADVQAHQLGVLRGIAGGEDLQRNRIAAFGQVFQHQLAAIQLEGAALAVHHHARQVERLAVQAQRLRRHIGIAAQRHAVEHARLDWIQVEGQVHMVDPERRSGIVLA